LKNVQIATQSSAVWGRLRELVSFFGYKAAIIFGILGALSIHRRCGRLQFSSAFWVRVLRGCSAFWVRIFGILGAI
jgi:hypothetical protein